VLRRDEGDVAEAHAAARNAGGQGDDEHEAAGAGAKYPAHLAGRVLQRCSESAAGLAHLAPGVNLPALVARGDVQLDGVAARARARALQRRGPAGDFAGVAHDDYK